ncbi:TonB-dependent siderophore receptor [Bdellovibrio sp. 22V]|uniref:TonB-dependent siderophore receptor n=1 Tax=Bdellovibrio TaxID=958 RepID=UPI002543E54A|nr:TonB-dependent siderophore receptor [Bdellovibrio sp. 22V]WII73799.1 TonB-dependent siderophore receptor [Bdellovibrio sp. 22V]
MGSFKLTAILLTPFFAATSFAESQLSTITIKNPGTSEISDVSGMGEIPVKELPVSVKLISNETMQAQGIHRLADITLIDASATDSYTATGYWDYLSLRGFTLDNRGNYLREGLPINAETSMGLDNKERLEILKGLTGVQTGTSAPGGLVNYVVKRPTNKDLRVVRSELNDKGNVLTAADVGGRVQGFENAGYRMNIAYEKLEPHLRDSDGSRALVSLANDLRLGGSALVETEIEWSRRSQPSQAGFSLLGPKLPEVADPSLNLNNQAWTQPVVFTGLTGSVKFSQTLSESVNWNVIVGSQNLTTDDRLAYPYGCSAENNYDRYCSDGTFDMYDYRSENERREMHALKMTLQKQAQLGESRHQFSFGILGTTANERFQRQAYNYAGIGNVQGTGVGTANATLNDESTNRDSQNAEASVMDAVSFGAWQAWLGLRYTYIHRASVRTDGSRAVDNSQNFVIPWGALSYDFEKVMAYISMGEGVESFVVPNKAGYTQRGEFVPDVISRQIEIGLRGGEQISWSLAAFQINRPVVEDKAPDYKVDGEAVHRGLEAQATFAGGRWQTGASVMYLDARREDSQLNPAVNGNKPVNVPHTTLRANVNYQVPSFAGLAVNSRVSYEGERAVLADNSILLPGWTRVDAGVSYEMKWEDIQTQWRLSVENITDQRYWREAPTQYGHIYLYPGEERSVWLSLQAAL